MQGLFPSGHAVGIRSICEEERAYVARRGMQPWYAHRIRQTPGRAERGAAERPPEIYRSLDVDGLDPSVLPGTGTPEPGGLSWADLLALFGAVRARCRVLGADVTEVAPIAGQVISQFTAARICGKIIAYFAIHPE